MAAHTRYLHLTVLFSLDSAGGQSFPRVSSLPLGRGTRGFDTAMIASMCVSPAQTERGVL